MSIVPGTVLAGSCSWARDALNIDERTFDNAVVATNLPGNHVLYRGRSLYALYKKREEAGVRYWLANRVLPSTAEQPGQISPHTYWLPVSYCGIRPLTGVTTIIPSHVQYKRPDGIEFVRDCFDEQQLSAQKKSGATIVDPLTGGFTPTTAGAGAGSGSA